MDASMHSMIESDDESFSYSSATGPDDVPQEDKRDEVKEVEKMAKKETRNLTVWKTVMFLSILATAALISAGTYWFLRREEQDDMEDSYLLFANSVEDATQFYVRNIFLSLKSASNSITGAADSTNSTFPFVTVPKFELLGEATRQQSGIELLWWSPIVEPNQLLEWSTYSSDKQGWIEQSRELVLASGEGTIVPTDYLPGGIAPFVFSLDIYAGAISLATERSAPYWQASPPPFSSATVNVDLLSISNKTLIAAIESTREGLFDAAADLSALTGFGVKFEDHEAFHVSLVDFVKDGSSSTFEHPHAIVIEPIFRKEYDTSSDIVGLIYGILPWDRYLVNLLPEGVKGLTAVLRNTCGQEFTYELDGNSAFYRGEGDTHDTSYDDMRIDIPFDDYMNPELVRNITGHCMYSFSVYPSATFEDQYRTLLPVVMTVIVASTFVLMTVVFLMYNRFVERRNQKVVGAAARSGAIVSSLFPSTVRDRLFAEASEAEETKQKRQGFEATNKNRLKNFMNDEEDVDLDEDDDLMYKTKPIADLFPETTIMFADLAGFTAWSSTREPTQVFTLLETIYRAFDEIAKKRRVFKVETIGDCYVAVTGLPDPRRDHAVAMSRFARDCMHRMHSLVNKLEVRLGPDTADLALRVGLHSGPVTAGVLRGEKSRFQLFGDTMNTASRMESTGTPDKIQISQETADLLLAAGKTTWFAPRVEKVHAKGKGMMQTYWLAVGTGSSAQTSEAWTERSTSQPSEGSEGGDHSNFMAEMDVVPMSAKTSRMLQWNVDVLSTLLKKILAQRGGVASSYTIHEGKESRGDATILEEVTEIITLPSFNGKAPQDTAQIELDPEVVEQLEAYVSAIASMYRANYFHNFEHASHVTLSVVKLLSRIVAPDVEFDGDNVASTLHDHTYGITSDPMTQFACVFSALIHDVDHSGVPNAQLNKENPELAAFYKNKSVAEQNSVDLSWNLLMDDSYAKLRSAMFGTDNDQKHFRQLVVNSVMATDIMDKDLKTLRNARWDKAFSGTFQEESRKEVIDRKATIVIEHLIQASDVAHTMQHWHIYRKWNERLFYEMYSSYVQGRSETDPSTNWYKGEIGFFDFYVIPLAKKLKECGVFGVSSDEYLNYAEKNRMEWEAKGQEVVAEMLENARTLVTAKGETTSMRLDI